MHQYIIYHQYDYSKGISVVIHHDVVTYALGLFTVKLFSKMSLCPGVSASLTCRSRLTLVSEFKTITVSSYC